MSKNKIITNITDPKLLEKIGWHCIAKKIFIITKEPLEKADILPELIEVLVDGSFKDTIDKIQHLLKENSFQTIVIKPGLLGIYLLWYFQGFKAIDIVQICKGDKLEEIPLAPGRIRVTKRKILEYIKNNPELKIGEILKGSEITPNSSAYQHVHDLYKWGLITVDDSKCYNITEMGKTFVEILNDEINI